MFVKLGWLEISGRSQYHILDRAELEARDANSQLVDAAAQRRSSPADRAVPALGGVGSARCAGRSGSCTKPCSAPSTTTISQSARPAHAARSASMSAAGVNVSAEPKIASVGHISVGRRRAARSCGRALPVVGRAQHPVERDRGIEAVAGRGLERVVAAHAEAEHADPGDAVFHHEEVGRARQHLELLMVVEVGDHVRTAARSSASSSSGASRRTARPRTPRARASRAGGPCPRRADATRRCRGGAPRRRAACRRDARARSGRRPRRSAAFSGSTVTSSSRPSRK